MRPTTGTALGGRYRLDRQIAVGGMGEVWVAHDLSLRRDVAVKVLREEFAGDAAFLERFRTEARNAASLSHPNIAATHDYGEQSGSSYLVMELVTGEPLSDLLERRPVLPEATLLPILAQTARALHAAHLAGLVHRDVKPGNILLGPGGRVKITDFGVSKAPDQAPMTATGMVMGTAQYLSPEQAVGRPATPASDLYSLGVVAYEALAGHRPFTGPTAVDIAVAHVNTPVPPLPPTVSRPVADLVMRLLSKDPADRPPSAGALARSLDALVGHTPPGGVPVVDDPPAALPGRRPDQDRSAGAPARWPAPGPPPAPAGAPAASPAAVPPPSVPPASVSPASVTPAAVWPAAAASTAPGAARVAPPGRGGPAPAAATPLPPSYPPRLGTPDPRTVDGRTATAGPGSRPTPPPARPQPAAGPDGARPAPVMPSTGTRTATRAAPPGTGPAGHPDGQRSGPGGTPTPVRTSTTTGRRFGRFGRGSWPLVALLLLLVALLVAALTDTVGGSGQDGAVAGTSLGRCVPVPGPGPTGPDGIITPCAPPGGPDGTDTTTAKDA